MLLPLQLTKQQHWALAAVHYDAAEEAPTVWYVDAVYKCSFAMRETLKRLARHLYPGCARVHFSEGFPFLPSQDHEYDCGVFVIECMERVIRQADVFRQRSPGHAVLFGQEHIDSKRAVLLRLAEDIAAFDGSDLLAKFESIVQKYAQTQSGAEKDTRDQGEKKDLRIVGCSGARSILQKGKTEKDGTAKPKVKRVTFAVGEASSVRSSPAP